MARHEGEFQAAGEAELDPQELARALARRLAPQDRARQDAIACCLSGSEGWRDAAAKLGGAFAPDAPVPGLTGRKEK